MYFKSRHNFIKNSENKSIRTSSRIYGSYPTHKMLLTELGKHILPLSATAIQSILILI